MAYPRIYADLYDKMVEMVDYLSISELKTLRKIIKGVEIKRSERTENYEETIQDIQK